LLKYMHLLLDFPVIRYTTVTWNSVNSKLWWSEEI